ncbi:MAG: hypothetical protein SOR72_06325 [Hornefia sp.]|nr:hypothetical protein [Hornefia sp.]
MNEVNKQENFHQNIQQREDRYEPMSVKDWLITFLIMIIPFVGFIMLFVWALSDNTNVNKQNWARAGFLMMGIMIAAVIVISVLSLFFR